jgi:hypothetical protein
MKQHVTLSVDIEVLSEFKKLVSNVSADVEGYMRDKLTKGGVSQVQTGPAVSRRQLEEMNREFIKTGRRVAGEEAYLRKIRKFDLLYSVAMQADLDWKGLTNLQECKAKMRAAWTGSSSLMQEFLIYLDWCQQRGKLEKQLKDIDEGRVRVAEAETKESVVSQEPVSA